MRTNSLLKCSTLSLRLYATDSITKMKGNVDRQHYNYELCMNVSSHLVLRGHMVKPVSELSSPQFHLDASKDGTCIKLLWVVIYMKQ